MKRGKKQLPDGDEAFSRWRHCVCLFYNNTGLVKYAQRRYQKRVRRAARREIEYEVENL